MTQEIKHMPILSRPHPTGRGGTQDIYRFDNGYGASVVFFWGSYGYEEGLLELAIIKFESDNPLEFDIAYDTPITDDVLGHLTAQEVQDILTKISELPKAEGK